MRNELAKDMYAGKVNREMDVKYGNDDATVSTTQAQAYLAEDKSTSSSAFRRLP